MHKAIHCVLRKTQTENPDVQNIKRVLVDKRESTKFANTLQDNFESCVIEAELFIQAVSFQTDVDKEVNFKTALITLALALKKPVNT